MNLLYKAEKKFGRYAIHNLMKYIIALNILGTLIWFMNSNIYLQYFSLDFDMILKGQVWRFFTFILEPGLTSLDPTSLLFFAVTIWLYYSIGTALENVWGAFRFNVFYLSGYLFSILASLLIYIIMGVDYPYGLQFINQSLFLAFAAMFPDMQFLLFFILPIKAKWMGIAYAALIVYEVMGLIVSQNYVLAIAIVISMLNFLIFFFSTRNYNKISPTHQKRRKRFKQEAQKAANGYRHKCAVCGRTEKDAPNLEFRYCSKCEGNYEYCSDHLFTHEHVHKH